MQNRNTSDKAKAGASFAIEQVDRTLYNALRAVFIDGAYCAQALTKALKGLTNMRAHPFVTSAFYGVLDNNVRLEHVIGGLCDREPDKNSAVVLKIGIYYCNYADMPPYAAVNRAVDLAKRVGVFSGFVNAVLKKSIGYEPKFKSAIQKFSYDCNTPEWLCKEVISDYGEDEAAEILKAVLPQKTHIRPVAKRITTEQFKSAAKGGQFTEYGCYVDRAALDNFAQGTVAVQSVSSIRAVNTYIHGIASGRVLDLCAAPGGKSVYLSELGEYNITACDIYPHKLDLMRGYAKKLGAKFDVALNDATKENADFVSAFDLVIADCPCSGTGTLKTKPDIMIKRTAEDIAELCDVQLRILDNVAKYCKNGGTLCYSTCSILKKENEEIADKFIKSHPEYTELDRTKFLPNIDKCDGFFIARFKRTTE
ncbi:MAG: methyltransferase domain-containing protein [Clostridiales bacterium]|nr:methyltransferase domain-containing protein [Clostridiales bacterium]